MEVVGGRGGRDGGGGLAGKEEDGGSRAGGTRRVPCDQTLHAITRQREVTGQTDRKTSSRRDSLRDTKTAEAVMLVTFVWPRL